MVADGGSHPSVLSEKAVLEDFAKLRKLIRSIVLANNRRHL